MNDVGFVIWRRCSFGTRDQAWSLKTFCVAKWKSDRESFWHRHQKGGGECPPCWCYLGSYILLKLVITINWKNVSSLWKFYQTHSHNLHFSVTGFSSVQSLSCVRLFTAPWTTAHQASLSIANSYSNSCPSSRWCRPTIHPLLSSSPPAFNLSQHQGLFNDSGGQSTGVSASASILTMNTQNWSPLG